MRVLTTALALAASMACGPASAEIFHFAADLTGAAEVPPNASPGTGTADVLFDDAIDEMTVDVTFSGLLGTTFASHIHSATAAPGTGTAAVATQVPSFSGFPLGVTSGTYHHVFDMTDAASWNPTFITNHGGTTASAADFLLASMQDGTAYLNIHSSFAAGGEIRGFLAQVPEPSTWALMLAGFGLAGSMLRLRRNAVSWRSVKRVSIRDVNAAEIE